MFKELRRLGQRIPLTWVNAGGDEVVARAFWGGTGEDGGFHFDKPLLILEEAADRLDDLVAQVEVAVHAIAPQIQIAIFQAQLFLNGFAFDTGNLERKLFANAI
ncbi:MAG: hypothetical protein SVX43_17980 [Cyanobacteriota bacterium]|nr:hypothetical protein [Cyanobacteriota bacterium]